jgi:hypothetical protein
MRPEEYRSLVLSITERNEDVEVLLGLVYLLEGCSSEEALTKNFTALRGKERARECKELLTSLIKKRVLICGPYDEYICPAGHEKVFEDTAVSFLQEPHDLSNYFEKAVKEGNKAAIKLIELLLKMPIHGITEFTQYEIIKNDLCDTFSPAVFRSVEEEVIKENLCIYGKKRRREFLGLYQNEEKIEDTKERVREWRAEKLAAMPVTKMLEKVVEELVEETKKGAKERRAEFAEWAKFSKEEIENIEGHFSGFAMDDSFLFLTGDLLVRRDTLNLVVTDSLSRYDVREWRGHPVVFVADEIPRWIEKMEYVFRGAYPELSKRKVSIVVPNKVAYSNFKQELLYDVVDRLGINEILEL